MNNETDYEKLGGQQDVFSIAIDIGGSLAKVVFASDMENNKLAFETVETAKINDFMRLLHVIIDEYNGGKYEKTRIVATGGGAFKFYDLMIEQFPNIKEIVRLDEMDCLTKGLDFFIHKVPDEVFTYNDQDGEKMVPIMDVNNGDIYPYMLVNIGSGVSILRVDGANKFVRVGGSSLGGGTLWGLLSLITGAKTYDEMLAWANQGDNGTVDMLVGDIYGTDYGKIGLKSSNIASSFGKVFQRDSINVHSCFEDGCSSPSDVTTRHIQSRTQDKFNNADISKSLLFAISNNIGQIAYLQAKIHNVKRIYFGGSYIRGHLTTMNTLSYAINFWSKGEKSAFFLKHEGYLGAVGAFLTTKPDNSNVL